MTIAEIKTALETSPDLLGQIVSSFNDGIVKTLESSGMIVRTKEQDDAFVNTQLNTQLETKLSARVNEEFGKSMRNIDEQIKTLTGIEKNNSEKTTDYAKRAFEEKNKQQGGDPVTKARVQELENLIATTKADYEKKLSDANDSIFKKEIDFQVSGFLDSANVAIPAHLKTEEEKNAFVQQQKTAIRSLFAGSFSAKRDESGNIIFYDGDKPAISNKDGKAKTAPELITEKFGSWFVPSQKSAQGSGVKPEGGGGNGKASSTDEIHSLLAAEGLAVGTKEYYDRMETVAKESGIQI